MEIRELMIMGRGDFIPVDSWALKVVSKEWYNGQPIGRPQVEAAFAAWGEWKGLAYWFWNYAGLVYNLASLEVRPPGRTALGKESKLCNRRHRHAGIPNVTEIEALAGAVCGFAGQETG